MRYVIWHAKNPNFDNYIREDSPCNPNPQRRQFPQDYEEIAMVECRDLEHLFRATNHINKSWLLNPEVMSSTVPDIRMVRSTSVGDIVVEVATGKKFYCQLVGWKEIT